MDVRMERVGSIAVVTLDRPEVKNAINDTMRAELRALLAEAACDEEVRGLVLTGNGAFCAGADLRHVVKTAAAADDERRTSIEGGAQGLIRDLVALPFPTAAAVDGPAIGMGFDMALACDRLIIGPEGWCMQGWGRVGLIPGTGGDLMLRLRNPSVLWRLLADQPRVGGDDAERWCLGEAARTASALSVAGESMGRLATLPRPALEAYVSFQRADLRARLDEHLARCAEVQADLLGSTEFAARAQGVMRGPPPPDGPRQ